MASMMFWQRKVKAGTDSSGSGPSSSNSSRAKCRLKISSLMVLFSLSVSGAPGFAKARSRIVACTCGQSGSLFAVFQRNVFVARLVAMLTPERVDAVFQPDPYLVLRQHQPEDEYRHGELHDVDAQSQTGFFNQDHGVL